MSRRSRRMILGLAGAALVGCSGEDAALATRRSELETRRLELVVRYGHAQSPLRRLQAAALDAEGVRAAQQEFNGVLRARLMEIDPTSGEVLDRALDVGAELDRLSGPVILAPGDTARSRTEDQARVVGDLAATEKALRPLLDSAFRYPDVVLAFRKLRDSVTVEMVRVDPGAQRVLDRLAEIERQIAEIDRELSAVGSR